MLMEDTSKYIFDYLYTCRVPIYATLTENELRTFGTVYTGNPDIDRGTREQLITVMWPISKMAIHFAKGDIVRVSKYSDTKEIYERVQAHLLAWQERLNFAVNVGDAPLQDLIILDEFANSVYEHAKFTFTTEYVENLLVRDMKAISAINMGNIFKPRPTQTTGNVKEVNSGNIAINGDIPIAEREREALSDVFKNRLVGGSRWR